MTRAKKLWLIAWLGGVVLLVGLLGAWWHRRPALPSPPMPSGIHDPEIVQAIERARQAALDQPRSADAWGRLGMVLLAHLFDREADSCFAVAARLDPTNPMWPYGRGLIALKRDPDNAVPLLRQAAAAGAVAFEQRSGFRMQLAEALLERRELGESEELFREELALRPGSHRAVFGLGLAALARGDTKVAAGYLRTARASPFARKTATAQLAALARAHGDEAAAAKYEKETSALPDDQPWPDPLLNQILDLQVGHRGRERAVAQLEKAGRFKEAADAYLEQIEARPTSRAYVGAGINLARLGDYERALTLLREGAQRDADSAQAHYSLGLVLFMRAEKEWRQRPGSARAREWFREAIVHSRRATELKPDHGRAYLHWGLALKYLGQPAEAVAPLRQGVACRPVDIDLQFALGDALLEVGQFPEAETHLNNARQLDPKDPRPAQALERLRGRGKILPGPR